MSAAPMPPDTMAAMKGHLYFRLKPKSELAACPCTTFVTLTSEAGKVT